MGHERSSSCTWLKTVICQNSTIWGKKRSQSIFWVFCPDSWGHELPNCPLHSLLWGPQTRPRSSCSLGHVLPRPVPRPHSTPGFSPAGAGPPPCALGPVQQHKTTPKLVLEKQEDLIQAPTVGTTDLLSTKSKVPIGVLGC